MLLRAQGNDHWHFLLVGVKITFLVDNLLISSNLEKILHILFPRSNQTMHKSITHRDVNYSIVMGGKRQSKTSY